jgi:hypothetical protein
MLSIAAAIAVQLVLIAAWAGAMKTPGLHKQPVGLAVEPGGVASAAAFTAHPAGDVVWQSLADPATAQHAVSSGDLAAAVAVSSHDTTVYLASGASPITAQALGNVLMARGRAAHLQVRVDDLRPPEPGDPRTLGLFVLILGLVVGGIAGAMFLHRARGGAVRTFPGAAQLLMWEAVLAIVAAILVVTLVDPVLGMIVGHPVAVTAISALVIWSVAAFVTAMLSVFGPWGAVLAIGCLVAVGNPVSGAMVPSAMLPSGWRFLSEIAPNSAGVRLVRSVTYFGGHGISDPLIVLSIYAAASVLVTLGLALRRSRVRPGTRALELAG